MEHFTIEYARMRQKEIDREIAAIEALRLARRKKLSQWCKEVLIKTGPIMAGWGRRIRRRVQPFPARPGIVYGSECDH